MSNIRWRAKDKIAIRKKLNAYNSKLKREMKKGTDVDLLPEKLSMKELKSRIKIREDFNREMGFMDDFTNRYSMNLHKTERGGLIPTWFIHQAETKIKQINKDRRKQLKTYENMMATDRNMPLGVKAKEVRPEVFEQFSPKKLNLKYMSKNDFRAYKEGLVEYYVTKEQKDEDYRKNLYKSIDNHYPPEKAERLKRLLDNLSTDVIVQKYYTDENLDIKINYDRSDNDILFSNVFQGWQSVLDEERRKAKLKG